VLNGAILDVTIGMLLLFLVASLVASAIVEAIGGYLHRRSKHLWDTLDLLLGNTSSAHGETQSIVARIYAEPFITGLVRPTDRLRFDPVRGGADSRAPAPPKKLPQRARARKNMQNLPMGAAGEVPEAALRRRFYGPVDIHPREFANALLSSLRPKGSIDRALSAVKALDAAMPADTAADVALSDIAPAIEELRAAADSLKSARLGATLDRVAAAGDAIPRDELVAVVRDAEEAVRSFLSGTPTTAEVVELLDAVPADLRTKLLAVAGDVGSEFTDIRAGIEHWYERNMAAASSWYRKQTRWFLFLAGLVLAVGLNVDAVHAATTLYQDESVRDGLVAVADEVSAIDCAASEPTASSTAIDLDCFRDQMQDSVTFPVGWQGVDHSFGDWVLRVFGWLFVATAVTLGAPFWFDLLGRALAKKHAKPPRVTS
jgi:hypothetical protein